MILAVVSLVFVFALPFILISYLAVQDTTHEAIEREREADEIMLALRGIHKPDQPSLTRK